METKRIRDSNKTQNFTQENVTMRYYA